MSKVRKSILLSLGQNYASFVIQFIVSILLARILTPAEIGLYSIAAVLISFANSLRDFGISTYIIQERDLTADKIQSAFTLTLCTAWILALTVYLGSHFAAQFYHQAGVEQVMHILAINFLLIPFGTVPMAYMYRQMEFRYVTLIKFITNITSSATTLALAYLGYSYLSMAWGSVSGIVCTFILVQLWRSKDLPLTPGFKELRKVLKYASLSSFITILIDIGQTEADLIMGRVSGMTMVGYFGRASGLITAFDTLVMRALWDVTSPYFSDQFRKDHSMKESFEQSLSLLSIIAWPFFVNLALMAKPIVLGLYGKQWEASIIPLQLLCLFTLIKSPFMLMGVFMPAIGKLEQNLYQLLMRIPVRAALVLYSAPMGLLKVGEAFVISGLIESLTDFTQCKLAFGLTAQGLLASTLKSFWVTLIASLPALLLFLIDRRTPDMHPWTEIMICLFAGSITWLGSLFVFKHPIRQEILSLLKNRSGNK